MSNTLRPAALPLTQDTSLPVGYRVVDGQTGEQVGKTYSYANRSRARAQADKLDNAYGAYRYRAVPVYAV